jgi:short-subunit dehydrogenase
VFDFAGKTAIVTGASRGIGEACVRQLDAGGARVALVARSADAMETIARELQHDPVVIAANLATDGEASRVAEAALTALGGIDVVVNNAGLAWNEPAEAITPKRLDLQLNVNLRSVILLTSALGESLTTRRGAVVNISSAAAFGGAAEQAVYAATKGA